MARVGKYDLQYATSYTVNQFTILCHSNAVKTLEACPGKKQHENEMKSKAVCA